MSDVVIFYRWRDWNIFYFKEFADSSCKTMFFTQILEMMSAIPLSCNYKEFSFASRTDPEFMPIILLISNPYWLRKLLHSLHYAWSPVVSRTSKNGTPTTSLVENLWKNHLPNTSIRPSFEWPLRSSAHLTAPMLLEPKTFAKPGISPF